jgi:multiple sugar transport system ATP-binding protein
MNIIDTAALPELGAAVGAGPLHDGFVGVRPENVRLAPAGSGQVAAQVELIESLGPNTLIYAHVGARGLPPVQIVVAQNTRSTLHPGDTVGLDFAPSTFHLFNRQGQTLSRAA